MQGKHFSQVVIFIPTIAKHQEKKLKAQSDAFKTHERAVREH